jgi:hypothetical protein
MTCVSTGVTAAVRNVLLSDMDAGRVDVSDRVVLEDPGHFGVQAQVFIGEPGDEASDSFDLIVCSPSWFAERAARDDWEDLAYRLTEMPRTVFPGAGVWFMRRWDQRAFEAALAAICTAASGGPDWGAVASRIGRLIPWEFEYKYDAHVDGHYGQSFPPSAE